MNLKKLKNTTLVIFFLCISRISSHCRYDMNLEYLEIMNIESSFKTSLPKKLEELKEEDRFRIGDKEEYFVQVVSKDISLRNYAKNFLVKKNIVKKNIERMIVNNCERVYSPIDYGTVLGEGFFGQVVEASASIEDGNLTYDTYGNTKIIVKIMKNKKSSGNDTEDFYKYLSDISKEVRAGQCLYNINNYDFDSERFFKIRYAMEDRDLNISAIVNHNPSSILGIDAVGIMDCKYYTPTDISSNQSLKSANITEHTKFYLGMPAMDGNLEDFFFGDDTYMEKKERQGENITDNVEFRLRICYRMIEALNNIHNLGFINKDIKPENFLYLEHSTWREKDPDIVVSLADFGLSGIDDYNTFQYSDINYRPYDDRFEMTKKLDVYQLGISLFQVLFNIPKKEVKGNITLKMIGDLTSPNGMSELLKAHDRQDWSIMRKLNLALMQENCVKTIVEALYNGLNNYSFPNKSYSYNFDNFELEIKNVRLSMNSGNYYEITSQPEFQAAIRPFFIMNYVDIQDCSIYSRNFEFRVKRLINRSISVDPASRLSANNLLQSMNRVIMDMDRLEGKDISYRKVVPFYRRILI